MKDEYHQCSRCEKRAVYCITKYGAGIYLDYTCEKHKSNKTDSNVKQIRQLKW